MKLNYEKYKELYPNIYLVENFICPEKSGQIIKLAEEYDAWKTEDPDDFWADKFGPDLPQELIDDLAERTKDLFFDQYNMEWQENVMRHLPGQYMHVHSDNAGFVNPKYENVYNVWGLVLYLNDHEGGEVFYPEIGIKYKPKFGDLLIHPTNLKYSHGTKPVKEGSVRYYVTLYAKAPYAPMQP